MRFVSQEINSCLENGSGAQANFGLIFNKWLSYHSNGTKIEPKVAQNRGLLVSAFKSVKNPAAEVLKQRHIQQAQYCQGMEKAGWTPFVFHAKLTAPFVSGLGMAHPTETGLVLDHTSGMPYIPAAGQKGVLRLAHLINSLQDEEGNWLNENLLRENGVIDDRMNWLEDNNSKTLYGSSDDKNTLAGQLTILDAYPLQPPELGEDILNPHYNDYYQGNRGPTEDQSPVPVKFLVVKPGAEFVFRVLLRLPYRKVPVQDQTKLIVLVRKNIERAITEVGMGAKTSLGFGRFHIISAGTEAPQVISWIQGGDDIQKPWLAYIREIKTVSGWGGFRQKVLDADIDPQWQLRKDVAKAVEEAARLAHDQRPDKWDNKRDQLVADWLKPSGITWQRQSSTDKEVAANPLLEKIRSYKSPANYDHSLDISSLDIECCRVLQPLFKQWKWNKKGKKTKARKLKLWKNLQERMTQLK